MMFDDDVLELFKDEILESDLSEDEVVKELVYLRSKVKKQKKKINKLYRILNQKNKDNITFREKPTFENNITFREKHK
jgi:hypothetical protein